MVKQCYIFLTYVAVVLALCEEGLCEHFQQKPSGASSIKIRSLIYSLCLSTSRVQLERRQQMHRLRLLNGLPLVF